MGTYTRGTVIFLLILSHEDNNDNIDWKYVLTQNVLEQQNLPETHQLLVTKWHSFKLQSFHGLDNIRQSCVLCSSLSCHCELQFELLVCITMQLFLACDPSMSENFHLDIEWRSRLHMQVCSRHNGKVIKGILVFKVCTSIFCHQMPGRSPTRYANFTRNQWQVFKFQLLL